MKFFFFICFLLISLNADEMQRLESIVKDIEKLRIDYEFSQTKLQECQTSLQTQKENLANNEIYINKIKNLENQIKKLENSLKNKNKNTVKIKEKKIISLNNKINTDKCIEKKDNEFPNLKMREKQEKDTTPTTYRLNQDSIIYSSIDGKEIAKWEKSTSFTSTLRIGKWIQISGYFVNKQWQKAQKQIWVKASNALKRD
ncbi:hypothetical protein [Sulfurimonas sp. C5]|uniref:hypothetical protein n=1 Tax=Sulfurimonas sp. C5 TaxID=3036947 RepID=UPI002457EF95|nr:hypothetical protein [Sulfurimonas sp. C5]MDH4943805.1 hypothetical protein [Sulfurimonas sp. C5]